MPKPVKEKVGEQLKTIEEQTVLLKGLPEALVDINKPMIEYEKDGERLRGTEEEGAHYVNLDRGIDYDVLEKFPKVSVLHLLGTPEEWKEARLATGKETSSPQGNNRSPESNVPTSSHFKQASK